jgi:hypothetical protein
MQLPDSAPTVKSLRSGLSFTIQEIEQTLVQSKIFCMASGQIGNDLKLFFYAQLADKSGYFLIETVVNQQTRVISAHLKSTRTDLNAAFINGNFFKGFVNFL